MEKEYFLCSPGVISVFPDLEKSNPVKSGYNWDKDSDYYVVVVDDWKAVEDYYTVHKGIDAPDDFWIYQIIDSQVDLTPERRDLSEYGEDDYNPEEITLDDCKRSGLFVAIEEHLSLTKEQNIAYAVYKLADKYDLNPIEFANLLSK